VNIEFVNVNIEFI